jgi:hypothetical protein
MIEITAEVIVTALAAVIVTNLIGSICYLGKANNMIKITAVIVTALIGAVMYFGYPIHKTEIVPKDETSIHKTEIVPKDVTPITNKQLADDTRDLLDCMQEIKGKVRTLDGETVGGVEYRVMHFSENNECGTYTFRKSEEQRIAAAVRMRAFINKVK